MPPRLWYLRVNGQPTGPFKAQELRSLVADGRIAPNDRLRCTGDPKWHRARKIVGLLDRPAASAGEPSCRSTTEIDLGNPLARQFSDVNLILEEERHEQQRRQSARAANAAGKLLSTSYAAEGTKPEPVCTPPVIATAVVTAVATYFVVAYLASRVMPHDGSPALPAAHEPTAADASVFAQQAIIFRTDPKSAQVANLELLRQTGQLSATSPAWFTFRGQVRWTNSLGAPVEADFGVIIRYDPRSSTYSPDLVERGGRLLTAELEICGTTRRAELETLVRELFTH